jgi:hypothetical protein
MSMRWRAGAALAACVLTGSLLTGCTGGQESSANETELPKKNSALQQGTADANATPAQMLDAAKELKAISGAIPVYAGARFRDDLTRRDSVMVRQQYGPSAQVYTLATDDSFPQVWHYYTTYLAQFRAYAPPSPYPPESQNWRTMEIPLNQVMQDPFIPGDVFPAGARHVLLQVAETEAEPKTVIRYIVTPEAVQTPVAVVNQ